MSRGRRKGEPSGQNDLCGVGVGVISVATVDTPEFRLALTVLGGAVTARAAFNTGIRRVHFDHGDTGNLRFVLESLGEQAPAGTVNGPVQSSFGLSPVRQERPRLVGVGLWCWLTHHVFDPQIFEHEHIVGADQRGRGLLDPIFSPIRCPRVQSACGSLRGFAPVRFAFLPGQLSR